MNIQYVDSNSDFSQKDRENVLFIGPKDQILKEFKEGQLANSILKIDTISVEADGTKKLLSSIVDGLSPSTDSPASSELWLQPIGAGGPRRVVLGALPTACSRHNSPALPHSVTQLVRTNKADAQKTGRLTVVLLLAESTHAFAAGTAVARAFSLYSRKTGTGASVLPEVEVVFNYSEADMAPTTLKQVAFCSEGAQMAARLVDTPPDVMNPTALVEEANAVAQELGVKQTVISGEALRNGGFGGIWGVGKASVYPPALVVLSYTPPGTEEKPSVVWAGKGITYDTGGLSIKGKTAMPGMKMDLGGAAAVLGAFRAAVKGAQHQQQGGGPPLGGPLHCVLCIAENSVGGDATRPDDVLDMKSGKTVEVNNTDAEGRLVLADGVAYAVESLGPVGVILDLATLTYAQGVSTGLRHAALYCNSPYLEEHTLEAGRWSGDLCHAMPYCPEFYRSEFPSPVADMCNSVMNRANAQVSCAGQFIGNHLGADFSGHWCHIDMASPVLANKRGTGYGVALLLGLLPRLYSLPSL
eukprot:CAMPEP_0113935174 /NCGR_PEP_ID=MMETSP1339-20121228/2379_1 /TAXON_ID=94617 /ORGANISM="Fibrocapsa japonica" /LENGTH=526 /DNA_ID=CAMNT_0000937235 /DNA_START=175 /DNA_END=1755 /DNA_ORIENTATION=- /assembly_acc=CAM_ASM_000762